MGPRTSSETSTLSGGMIDHQSKKNNSLQIEYIEKYVDGLNYTAQINQESHPSWLNDTPYMKSATFETK
jgi:hypothetical protein